MLPAVEARRLAGTGSVDQAGKLRQQRLVLLFLQANMYTGVWAAQAQHAVLAPESTVN